MKYTFSGSAVSPDICGNFAEICFRVGDGGIPWGAICILTMRDLRSLSGRGFMLIRRG